MKQMYLAVFVTVFSASSIACDCHGSSQFPSAFGSFASWQLPNAGCIPTHTSNSEELADETNVQPSVETQASKSDALTDEVVAVSSEN